VCIALGAFRPWPLGIAAGVCLAVNMPQIRGSQMVEQVKVPATDSIDAISQLLGPSRLTAIVDVGANPIDGDPPYKTMLQKGLCRVIGFEPQPAALAALNLKKSDRETYLPHIIGDGQDAIFRTCHAPGMSSLLMPDKFMLDHFCKFAEWGEVVQESPVSTRRLDDIEEISVMDFLKIDVQGSELAVFRHGHERLMQAVAIQTEVSFLPLYQDQPLLGEIDNELRGLGFVPHACVAINKRIIGPLFDMSNPYAGLNQVLEADIVYVRDFTKPGAMSDEQLKHLALIAYHCYGSFDLALNCIYHLQNRRAIAPASVDAYLRHMSQRRESP
jgi:FkbM family methyltransferase